MRHRCLKNGEKVLGRGCQNPGKYISGVNNLCGFFYEGNLFFTFIYSLLKCFWQKHPVKLFHLGNCGVVLLFLFIFCWRVSLGELRVEETIKDAVYDDFWGESQEVR